MLLDSINVLISSPELSQLGVEGVYYKLVSSAVVLPISAKYQGAPQCGYSPLSRVCVENFDENRYGK